jgi:hypothetical protein
MRQGPLEPVGLSIAEGQCTAGEPSTGQGLSTWEPGEPSTAEGQSIEQGLVEERNIDLKSIPLKTETVVAYCSAGAWWQQCQLAWVGVLGDGHLEGGIHWSQPPS